VARCELHSVAEVKGQEILLTVNSLNEFDSKITGVDWRQKIENQRGAVGFIVSLLPSSCTPNILLNLKPDKSFSYNEIQFAAAETVVGICTACLTHYFNSL
jgi:hypothetical protein